MQARLAQQNMRPKDRPNSNPGSSNHDSGAGTMSRSGTVTTMNTHPVEVPGPSQAFNNLNQMYHHAGGDVNDLCTSRYGIPQPLNRHEPTNERSRAVFEEQNSMIIEAANGTAVRLNVTKTGGKVKNYRIHFGTKLF